MEAERGLAALDEDLSALHDRIATAAGLGSERGDIIMRETLQEIASRERDNRQAELSLPTGVPMPAGEVEHRLMVLREGLIGGMSRPELVALAQQQLAGQPPDGVRVQSPRP